MSASLIQTVGYEGHTLASYLEVLQRAGVTLLCDVRRNPISRKPGFAKRALAAGCTSVGIRYEHLPALGIASAARKGIRTAADYAALFTTYERDTLPRETAALATIAAWVRAGERVALTCFERDAHACHRSRVTAALAAQYGADLTATHL